jgi:hypothetical protein
MPNEWRFFKLASHSRKEVVYGNSPSSHEHRVDATPSPYTSWCRLVVKNDTGSAHAKLANTLNPRAYLIIRYA